MTSSGYETFTDVASTPLVDSGEDTNLIPRHGYTVIFEEGGGESDDS